MEPTDRDVASFEAGIKLGAVYHQFIGTPVRPDTTESLEAAMEAAMCAQPACQSATVRIDPDTVEADVNRFGYTGLAGDHLEIEVTIVHEGITVYAELLEVDSYPLMQLVSIDR